YAGKLTGELRGKRNHDDLALWRLSHRSGDDLAHGGVGGWGKRPEWQCGNDLPLSAVPLDGAPANLSQRAAAEYFDGLPNGRLGSWRLANRGIATGATLQRGPVDARHNPYASRLQRVLYAGTHDRRE